MSRYRPFQPVSKYGAKRTNGYASKRESQYADELAFLKGAGQVSWWLEQVPIKLPGKAKYVADFLVCMADGRMRLVEIKGFETAAWKLKLRLLEEARPELFAILEVVR